MIYGTIGYCQFGKHRNVKLHCKIDGLVACMKCYGQHRMENPKVRRAHERAAKRYYKKNRARVRDYNRVYVRQRRAEKARA